MADRVDCVRDVIAEEEAHEAAPQRARRGAGQRAGQREADRAGERYLGEHEPQEVLGDEADVRSAAGLPGNRAGGYEAEPQRARGSERAMREQPV